MYVIEPLDGPIQINLQPHIILFIFIFREEAANKRRVEDKRRRSILKQVKQNMNTF